MPEEISIAPIKKKQYDRFTLVIYYTYAARKKNGGVEKETKRADITTLQFENRGIPTKNQHPLAILTKLYVELKPLLHSAFFYDNYQRKGKQQVCKIVIDKGREGDYGDRRSEYYDLQTGAPLDCPLNSPDHPNFNA